MLGSWDIPHTFDYDLVARSQHRGAPRKRRRKNEDAGRRSSAHSTQHLHGLRWRWLPTLGIGESWAAPNRNFFLLQKNVLIECRLVDPISIRRAARSLAVAHRSQHALRAGARS